ncbi:MAG: response regulator [Bacteroidia bacterium]|nr:response regulator [Bacteroidia bacterium]
MSETNPVNILLVDDVPANLVALEAIIERDNVRIFKAESGNEALKLAWQHTFSLALVDVQMPEMDGFELVRLLKSNSRTREIICIFVTAISKESRYAVKGLSVGAVDYLYKPLDPMVTNAKVDIYLELYRQRQRLLEQNQRLQQYALRIDNAADIIAVVNPVSMNFTEINPVVKEILGFEPNRITGTSILDYLHPEDLITSKKQFDLFLQKPEGILSLEVRFRNTRYDYIWLNLKVVYNLGLLFINARDVTFSRNHVEQITLARDEAEKARIAKEQFLANMSHEIRTPMNGIIGLTRLLQDTPLIEEQRETVGLIMSSSQSLLNIINDILDLSKIDSGKLQLEEIEFEVKNVIRTVFSLLRNRADEKQIVLEESIPAHIPDWVIGDPHRLNQILVNLIGNAIKFTEKGYVRIHLQMKEGVAKNEIFFEFRVEDSGIGIPEDKLESIFESFSQAGADTARKFGGTGLGLTISKKLVELQGGNIRVISKEGSGSTFIFTILYRKCENQEKENLRDKKNPFELKGLENFKALLVDDNKVNRMVGGKTLKRWNMEVDFAEDGKEAVAKAHEESFDIILMDIQMPEMDGYEAARIIRSSSTQNHNTPIIALTANVVGSVVTESQNAGMDAVLTKPFDPLTLYETLHRLITEERSPEKQTRRGDIDRINFAYLRELSGGNDQFVIQYLRTFIDHIPTVFSELKAAQEQNQTKIFFQALQRIKQDFIYIDYEAAKELIHKLESGAGKSNTGYTHEMLSSLEEMINELILRFQTILENTASINAKKL